MLRAWEIPDMFYPQRNESLKIFAQQTAGKMFCPTPLEKPDVRHPPQQRTDYSLPGLSLVKHLRLSCLAHVCNEVNSITLCSKVPNVPYFTMTATAQDDDG